MQVSNLWKIRISDYGEPAPHKQPLAELSDWIFLDLAPVCHSSHHSLFSLHADLLSLCMHCCFFLCLVWSHEFASLTTAVLPRETLPRTLCAIFSVRPSLPSACVTPSPYFPLIFTFFYR